MTGRRARRHVRHGYRGLQVLTILAVFFGVTSGHAAGDEARGQQLYLSRCTGCHSIDANRIGPSHAGVFGRVAGKFQGYDYSAALKASRLKWTEMNLDRWLKDPQKLVAGQKMGYSVPDATDRADLIAYLRTVP